MMKSTTSATLKGLPAAALFALPPALFARQDGSFIARYQARVTATQNEQPHWITPLATVTPRLEPEFRTGFVHQ